MSSYQIPEAFPSSDSSYLSVTCSVTATASINNVSTEWETNNTGPYQQEDQGLTYLPESDFRYGNQPVSDTEVQHSQSQASCSQQVNNTGYPDMDIQTEDSWANLYPPYDNIYDPTQCMDPREQQQSCIWVGPGQTAQSEINEETNQRYRNLTNGISQSMEYFPLQNGGQGMTFSTAEAETSHYPQLESNNRTEVLNGRGFSSFKDLNSRVWFESHNNTEWTPRRMSENSRGSEWTQVENGFIEQHDSYTSDSEFNNMPQTTHNNNPDCDSNITIEENKNQPFCSNRLNVQDIPKICRSPDGDSQSPVGNPHKLLMTLTAQRLPHELQNPLDRPGANSDDDQPQRPKKTDKTCPETSEPVEEKNSVVDVDHMISSGVMVAGYKPRNIIRKRAKSAVPKTCKDPWYWEKRRKNNESARRSREMRKEKEKQFYRRALELEYENLFLKERIGFLESKLSRASNPPSNIC